MCRSASQLNCIGLFDSISSADFGVEVCYTFIQRNNCRNLRDCRFVLQSKRLLIISAGAGHHLAECHCGCDKAYSRGNHLLPQRTNRSTELRLSIKQIDEEICIPEGMGLSLRHSQPSRSSRTYASASPKVHVPLSARSGSAETSRALFLSQSAYQSRRLR